ncbi:hypothetical protein DB44_AA00020 [Candidatus Protochlamydia amoebophila]|uniref:Uncharacterized protein n=1 Tax=Candidatus Protochlamydia amoebophila TaxID=362787 RepID=A0A0C1HK07_9BACT|nr:hypothetical protein DB44_AA00020 [Candidatus Protochlamydia amoebophila]
MPSPAYSFDVNLNDINFIIRIEKLIEKMNRYKDRLDSDGLIGVLLDIKHEVEGYTGKKFDIEKELKGIEKEINKQGGKFKKGELKAIGEKFKKKEKKHHHKAQFIADCINYGIEYDVELEHLTFMARHGQDKQDIELDIPIRLTVGVTIALCGVFLFFVPIPLCQAWAPRVITAGVGIAADGCMNRMEEVKKKP